MTVILAIDTSTTAVTVAVLQAGDVASNAAVAERISVAARSAAGMTAEVGAARPSAGSANGPGAEPRGVGVNGPDVVVRSVLDARGHTELLAPLVRDVLAEAGLPPGGVTAIAVGCGPGPFTGLRVGMVTALTLGHALEVPVHGVGSLDALAEEALASSDVPEVLVATDARRREVYWARYTRSATGAAPAGPPGVAPPAELSDDLRALPTAGRGPLLYPDLFPAPLRGPVDVDAGWLARVCLRRWGAGVAMPVEPRYLRRPDALTTAERGG
ncbi:MAG: tRNA (adenosine(37)-N6)-threonylcarbamoyltransferase complex dimerization subunit type 1 TsaB [Dermatophilaceae bacterium]